MTYKKLLKKLKRYIKKEWNIKFIDIKPDDTLLNIAERIVLKSENCNLEEAYEKWIISPKLHLPGWVSFCIAEEFVEIDQANQNTTIKELFDEVIRRWNGKN